jgi:hypothetical protein
VTFYRVAGGPNRQIILDTPAGGVQVGCQTQSSYFLNVVNDTGSPLPIWANDSSLGLSFRTIGGGPEEVVIVIFVGNATGNRHVTLRSSTGTHTTQWDMYFTTGVDTCAVSIAQQTAANSQNA